MSSVKPSACSSASLIIILGFAGPLRSTSCPILLLIFPLLTFLFFNPFRTTQDRRQGDLFLLHFLAFRPHADSSIPFFAFSQRPGKSPRPPRRPTRRSKRRSHKRLDLRSLRENLLRYFSGCITSSRTSIIFFSPWSMVSSSPLLAQTFSTSVTAIVHVFGYASG